MADVFLKVFERGGFGLVIVGLGYLLMRFMFTRGVKSFDDMTQQSMQATRDQTAAIDRLAGALQKSSEVQAIAVGGLTDRLAKMEGKVEVFGALAARGARTAPPALARAAVEAFDDSSVEGDGRKTPVHGVPIPNYVPTIEQHQLPPLPPKRVTPPSGYRAPARPATKGDKR